MHVFLILTNYLRSVYIIKRNDAIDVVQMKSHLDRDTRVITGYLFFDGKPASLRQFFSMVIPGVTLPERSTDDRPTILPFFLTDDTRV